MDDHIGTFVSVDLVDSTRFMAAANSLGVKAGADFRRTISDYVHKAAARICPSGEVTEYKAADGKCIRLFRGRCESGGTCTQIDDAGDGGMWFFDHPADAHAFSKAVHAVTQERNAKYDMVGDRHWFRTGIATGPWAVVQGTTDTPGGSMPGNAARLQAAAKTGGILIDDRSYRGLPADIQKLYPEPTTVFGKRDERFDNVRRCQVAEEALAKEKAEAVARSQFELRATAARWRVWGRAMAAGLVTVVGLTAGLVWWTWPPPPPRKLTFETWNWQKFRFAFDNLFPQQKTRMPWVNDRLDGTLHEVQMAPAERNRVGQCYFSASRPVPRPAGRFRVTAGLPATMVEHRVDAYAVAGEWPGWENYRIVQEGGFESGHTVSVSVPDGLRAGESLLLILRVFVEPEHTKRLDEPLTLDWKVQP